METRARCSILLVFGLAMGPAWDGRAAGARQENSPSVEPSLLRVGIAPGTWRGLNRNDATAAISAWAKSILKQRNIAVTVDTTLFESTAELANALRCGGIDCASMVTDQFFSLEGQLQPEEVFLAMTGESLTEQYVLLTRSDSGAQDLTWLRGRKLLVHSNARMSLALPWLDSLFAQQALDTPEAVLSDLNNTDKPSLAILPVFFRQADACLVTSNSFQVAGELNPQLRRELRVLAASPEVLPAVFFFRRGDASKIREQLEPAIETLHENPAGLQVLTVFQCSRMVKRSLRCFDGTREVLSVRDRLRRQNLSPTPAAAHPTMRKSQ